MQKASFGQRFIGWLIDFVILIVIQLVLMLVLKTLGSLLAIVVQAGYFVYFEGTQNGQTLGKKQAGIRVVPTAGGSMDPSKALIRWLCKIVSGIPCGLGYLWMLWDKDKQTWHDKLSSTTVIVA